ncbi:hypothetical protein Tco_0971138 [Tanacetum coccineum]
MFLALPRHPSNDNGSTFTTVISEAVHALLKASYSSYTSTRPLVDSDDETLCLDHVDHWMNMEERLEEQKLGLSGERISSGSAMDVKTPSSTAKLMKLSMLVNQIGFVDPGASIACCTDSRKLSLDSNKLHVSQLQDYGLRFNKIPDVFVTFKVLLPYAVIGAVERKVVELYFVADKIPTLAEFLRRPYDECVFANSISHCLELNKFPRDSKELQDESVSSNLVKSKVKSLLLILLLKECLRQPFTSSRTDCSIFPVWVF